MPEGDSYELWCYKPVPDALVLVRFFEGGRTWTAAGCYLANKADETFEAAYDALLAWRISQEANEKTDLFERIAERAVFARLGQSLEDCRTQTIVAYEPGVFGPQSGAIRARVALLNALDVGESALLGQLSTFEVLACTLLENPADDALRWTREREASGAERVEVLRHRFCSGVLLVHFAEEGLQVCAYLPVGQSESDYQAFNRAVVTTVRTRELLGVAPKALPELGPFSRINEPQLEEVLTEALHSLEAGQGAAHTYTREELTGAPAPNQLLMLERPATFDRSKLH
jgi:hypothetical protein